MKTDCSKSQFTFSITIDAVTLFCGCNVTKYSFDFDVGPKALIAVGRTIIAMYIGVVIIFMMF